MTFLAGLFSHNGVCKTMSQVHIKVSKMAIKFSNAPPHLPEERMRDRLELSFSKPSRGGGEVDELEYDPKTGTGCVTFCNTGGLSVLEELRTCAQDFISYIMTVTESHIFRGEGKCS